MRRLACRIAVVTCVLGTPLLALAEERWEIHPFATLSVGVGMAQDNATVSAASLASASLQGVAAFGPLAGVSIGADARRGAFLGGLRLGYQRSWLKQTLDVSLATGDTLHAQGSLDESLLLLARVGWTVSSVPVYLTGGWAWSWASSSVSVCGLPSLSERIAQDGGVVGVGVQPSIDEHWFLELEYLVVLYRQVRLATPLDALVDVQVRSIATTFTVGGGYRF